jgi:four helix bundle protein
MAFKFEKLEVWKSALDYMDLIYEIAALLPRSEEFNLKSQMVRAATSVALNIAEGSTSQTNAEQAQFLKVAMRSVVESVACQFLIHRRNLVSDMGLLRRAYNHAQSLTAQLQSMRRSITQSLDVTRGCGSEYNFLIDDENIDSANHSPF